MIDMVESLVTAWGVSEVVANGVGRGVLALVAIGLSALVLVLVKRVLVRSLHHAMGKSRAKWDDALVKHKVLSRLAYLAPAIVLHVMAPRVLDGCEDALGLVLAGIRIWMTMIGMFSIFAALDTVVDIYRGYNVSRRVPIKGVLQVVKLIASLAAGLIIIGILVNKNPLYLLTGLGALSAVLMLVFKDTILGFVAGIQLTANRMIARGDWIEMPSHGADGDVLEVTLTTVKVQNWDKTITTIPTYALITHAFKNWRGMQESAGRRIKRAVNLDMGTIRLCDEDMLERFARIQYIADYLEGKREEVARFNRDAQVDDGSLVNGRRLTNIGTFRAYVIAYLHNHPMINLDMTCLVRQLAPTPQGLPVEIYVFCKDKAWANYESIQADIFDHILAVVPEFDLKVYQEPSGHDVRGALRSNG
jgi:miniconductance mechanosensitive channel